MIKTSSCVGSGDSVVSLESLNMLSYVEAGLETGREPARDDAADLSLASSSSYVKIFINLFQLC